MERKEQILSSLLKIGSAYVWVFHVDTQIFCRWAEFQYMYEWVDK